MSAFTSGSSTAGKHRRRGSMLHESDGSVNSYRVDLASCEWVQGSDGLDHMRLPLWMHPQTEGNHP